MSRRRYEERGVTSGGQPFRPVGMVTVSEPPRRIEMTCRGDFGGERGTLGPANTRVAITLADLGERTRVTVDHDGFENLPEAYRTRIMEGFRAGWDRTVGKLAPLAVPIQASAMQRIGAPRLVVFRALIEPAALARWFCDAAQVEPRVGGVHAFGGPHTYGGPEMALGRITALDWGRTVEYVWPLAGAETSVAMTLREVSASAMDLEVAHTGSSACRSPGSARNTCWSPGRCPGANSTPLIAAPPERVWEMLTVPSHLDRWIAKQAFVELRFGGRYSYGWNEDGPHGSGPQCEQKEDPDGTAGHPQRVRRRRTAGACVVLRRHAGLP